MISLDDTAMITVEFGKNENPAKSLRNLRINYNDLILARDIKISYYYAVIYIILISHHWLIL